MFAHSALSVVSLRKLITYPAFLYRHFGKGRSAPTARGVFEEYQLSSEIGRGGFGTVRRAIGLNNGQTYAVKVCWESSRLLVR